MLDNLNKEIIFYSIVPVVIVALIIVVLLIFGKKKNNNYFEYNYSIKVLLAILITLVLSVMTGYSIWLYERVINMGTVSQNILYMILLAVLVISLFLSLVFMFIILYKDLKTNNLQEKEFQN